MPNYSNWTTLTAVYRVSGGIAQWINLHFHNIISTCRHMIFLVTIFTTSSWSIFSDWFFTFTSFSPKLRCYSISEIDIYYILRNVELFQLNDPGSCVSRVRPNRSTDQFLFSQYCFHMTIFWLRYSIFYTFYEWFCTFNKISIVYFTKKIILLLRSFWNRDSSSQSQPCFQLS